MNLARLLTECESSKLNGNEAVLAEWQAELWVRDDWVHDTKVRGTCQAI